MRPPVRPVGMLFGGRYGDGFRANGAVVGAAIPMTYVSLKESNILPIGLLSLFGLLSAIVLAYDRVTIKDGSLSFLDGSRKRVDVPIDRLADRWLVWEGTRWSVKSVYVVLKTDSGSHEALEWPAATYACLHTGRVFEERVRSRVNDERLRRGIPTRDNDVPMLQSRNGYREITKDSCG